MLPVQPIRGARATALLLVGAALVAGSPSAQAEHCDGRLVIFSGRSGTRLVNATTLTCSFAQTKGVVDPPVLTPGANAIQIRQTQEYTNLTTITVRLTGLGGPRTATLTKTSASTPLGSSTVYDSPELSIPAAQAGCLTVEIIAPQALAGARVSYRTADGSC